MRAMLMEHFKGKHILSTEDFSKSDILSVMKVAKSMEKYAAGLATTNIFAHKIMASLFFEPSTRTRLSFESAMLRLGGKVITVEQVSTTSLKKGETLEDTGHVVSHYADVIVMRHSEPYSVAKMSSVSCVPVINAGDGVNQHPTQALLDIYTIYKKKEGIDSLTIGMVGDLKHGRTVHSLIDLLCHYKVNFVFISPDELRIPKSILQNLQKKGHKVEETSNLEETIDKLDVLYATRIQQERFANPEEYKALKNSYCLDEKMMTKASENMILMHPLPRVDEISPQVDSDPRAVYFEQAKNGIPVRMALLAIVLGIFPEENK